MRKRAGKGVGVGGSGGMTDVPGSKKERNGRTIIPVLMGLEEDAEFKPQKETKYSFTSYGISSLTRNFDVYISLLVPSYAIPSVSRSCTLSL
ncbi:hypothetical protein E2C01_065747 [Portunus trituberculatus]|uniref:Uncharacterized protein n=1 Tax=Portunus trituberculatus TaxID=210409 RepID=A0A5B7HP52_PORTR|nr:hypothetical protein [Portunus trituberculatus]